MSNTDKWFLEAMQNAVAAGHLSQDGANRVKAALERDCPPCEDGLHEDCRDGQADEDTGHQIECDCASREHDFDDGWFECVVCGRKHFHVAPPECRSAYGSGMF